MAEGLPSPKLPVTESLSSYFEQSAATVQSYTGKFEQKYARPAINKVGTLVGERPVVGIFITIFTVMSIFPIITIIAVAIFAILSVIVTALTGVLVSITTVLLLLSSFLTAVLLMVFFLSALLTLVSITTLVFFRFILLVGRFGLTAGLFKLYDEVKMKFFSIPTAEDINEKDK